MKAEDEVTWFDVALETMTNADLAYSNRAGKAVLKNACKEYHQSQLQALKKEVEERKKGLEATYNQPNTSEIIKPDYYCSIKELEEVLNLITNLEDNG